MLRWFVCLFAFLSLDASKFASGFRVNNYATQETMGCLWGPASYAETRNIDVVPFWYLDRPEGLPDGHPFSKRDTRSLYRDQALGFFEAHDRPQ